MTTDQAIYKLRQAADLGLLEEYANALADGNPYDIGADDARVFVDSGDIVSVDLLDTSDDGFANHELGRVPGLYAELAATVTA